MIQITKELINCLTPLEKESAEWCYQGFQKWVNENEKRKEKDDNCITIAHLVFLTAYHFQPGALEAFTTLHKKGIIFNIKPDKEIGGDAHEIVFNDTIVVVHKLLNHD